VVEQAPPAMSVAVAMPVFPALPARKTFVGMPAAVMM
jgi:hypothetical protein